MARHASATMMTAQIGISTLLDGTSPKIAKSGVPSGCLGMLYRVHRQFGGFASLLELACKTYRHCELATSCLKNPANQSMESLKMQASLSLSNIPGAIAAPYAL